MKQQYNIEPNQTLETDSTVHFVREVTARYIGHGRKRTRIREPEDIARFARGVLKDNAREHVIALYLGGCHEVIAYSILAIGTANQATLSPRELFQLATLSGAVSFALAHNHPSGSTTPSDEDYRLTERLFEAGNLLDVRMLDHVVFTEEAFVSIYEEGRLGRVGGESMRRTSRAFTEALQAVIDYLHEEVADARGSLPSEENGHIGHAVAKLGQWLAISRPRRMTPRSFPKDGLHVFIAPVEGCGSSLGSWVAVTPDTDFWIAIDYCTGNSDLHEMVPHQVAASVGFAPLKVPTDASMSWLECVAKGFGRWGYTFLELAHDFETHGVVDAVHVAYTTLVNDELKGGQVMRQQIQQPKFKIGQTVATPALLEAVDQADINAALFRHERGDWGKVTAADRGRTNSPLLTGLGSCPCIGR